MYYNYLKTCKIYFINEKFEEMLNNLGNAPKVFIYVF